MQTDFMGKKIFSRTYLTFNDFVHVCQGKKNYMIRGLGKKINYPYPPTFSKVKWLAPYVSYCKMISNY